MQVIFVYFINFIHFVWFLFCEDPWPLSYRLASSDTAIVVADALALSGTVDSHSDNNMVLYNIVLHTAPTYNTNMYSENKSEFELTEEIPYLTLMGEL